MTYSTMPYHIPYLQMLRDVRWIMWVDLWMVGGLGWVARIGK